MGRFYTLGCMITVTLVCTVSRTLVSTSVRSCVGSSSDCLVSFRVCTWYVFFSPSCQPLRQRCVPRPPLRSSAPPPVTSCNRWPERCRVMSYHPCTTRPCTVMVPAVPAWWERMVIAPLSQPSCGHLALPMPVTSCDRRHERYRVTSCHSGTIRLCVVMTPVTLAWSGRMAPAPLSLSSCGASFPRGCQV